MRWLKPPGFGTPIRLYAWSLVCTAVTMALPSAWLVASYWGYWFRPPNVLPEVNQLDSVEQVIAVDITNVSTTAKPASVDASSIGNDPILTSRQWSSLVESGVLPADFELGEDLGALTDLHQYLPETSLLVRPQPGYEASGSALSGLITVGKHQSGEQLALVSVTGGQLENDHYPYYEMVFRIDAETQALTFVDGQRFFFDISGLEGIVQMPQFWLLLTLVSFTLLVIPPLTLAILWSSANNARNQPAT